MPTETDSTTPPSDPTAALTAAVNDLEDAVRHALADGGLDEKAADGLQHQVGDLRKWIVEGKTEDFDKKLDDLAKKTDELASKGGLDAPAPRAFEARSTPSARQPDP